MGGNRGSRCRGSAPNGRWDQPARAGGHSLQLPDRERSRTVYDVPAPDFASLTWGMRTYLVTLNLPRGHAGPHNPGAKVTGPCPLAPEAQCTDVTGEHHTTIWLAAGLEAVRERANAMGVHLTRVEEVLTEALEDDEPIGATSAPSTTTGPRLIA